MIFDTVEKLHFYAPILPHAAEIERRFLDGNLSDAPFEIRVKSYMTRPDEKRRFEVHAHTIDLMIGISGEEIIHICDPMELTPAEALPDGADGRKLDGAPRGHALRLSANGFIAIYPGEAHMVAGQTQADRATPLMKWVVKLPVEEA